MSVLRTERVDGVEVLRMDRPPANALDLELVQAIGDALTAAAARGARAVVFAGRPGMFSGGLDVPALLTLDRADVLGFWTAFLGLTRMLVGSPVPVVAAITGHAPAGGAVLAIHCDYRVAADGDFVIGLNEVSVGLPVPPSILRCLEYLVGSRQAARLAVQGLLVPMAEAAQVGLVDELCHPDEVVERAISVAQRLASLPPIAMSATRRSCKAELLEPLDEAQEAELATSYWFSDETQREMRRLAERLGRR